MIGFISLYFLLIVLNVVCFKYRQCTQLILYLEICIDMVLLANYNLSKGNRQRELYTTLFIFKLLLFGEAN